jgi:hypothetical protein
MMITATKILSTHPWDPTAMLQQVHMMQKLRSKNGCKEWPGGQQQQKAATATEAAAAAAAMAPPQMATMAAVYMATAAAAMLALA